MMMKEMVLSEVTLLLGSYPDPANSTSKYSDSVLGGNCLLGYALGAAPGDLTSGLVLSYLVIEPHIWLARLHYFLLGWFR